MKEVAIMISPSGIMSCFHPEKMFLGGLAETKLNRVGEYVLVHMWDPLMIS